MRLASLVLVCTASASALAAASVPAGAPSGAPEATARIRADGAVKVVRVAADSLVARHRAMPTGGWAWRSAIQAPHFQTDRDVGAAGIGEGLLAAYAVTKDVRYERAAVAAGDFLLGVAEPAAGGLRWPDWADPNGRRSTTHFTSFDDGAAGISDYLWRLFRVTRQQRFKTGALAGMRWLIAQAGGASCPQTACSWRWTDDPSWRVAYNGVGMGQAGIVLTLDAFADRTGKRRFRAYARAGAARLRELTENGARPLPRGSESATAETGFLSGSAGAAHMFLERYARDRDPADLETARGLLDWVNERAVADSPRGLSWPVSADDESSASGFELGAAGIAWVNLRAARATGDPAYREVARRAGAWLRRARLHGGAWPELPGAGPSPVHVGLDSGAAGISWVLEDLARAGLDPVANRLAARSALTGLRAGAARDRLGAFWYEHRVEGRPRLRAEPSWHWGSAGIAAFAARLAGWSGRGPGGQIAR
jgi:lantibiotic modifying enzyme